MQLPFLPPALLDKRPPPKWDPFTPGFSALSQSATKHPVRTLVIVALIASTAYLQMLEHSLFDNSSSFWSSNNNNNNKKPDLLDGSAKVIASQHTGWQWKENVTSPSDALLAKHLALVSLSFPLAMETPQPVLPLISAAEELRSNDPLTRVYAVPFDELPGFIQSVKTVPSSSIPAGDDDERPQWVMQTGSQTGEAADMLVRMWQAIKSLWTLIQVRIFICFFSFNFYFISFH